MQFSFFLIITLSQCRKQYFKAIFVISEGQVERLGARQILIQILPQTLADINLGNTFLNLFVVGQGQDCHRLNETAKIEKSKMKL